MPNQISTCQTHYLQGTSNHLIPSCSCLFFPLLSVLVFAVYLRLGLSGDGDQMYSQLSKQGQKENGSKKKPDHHRDGRPAERAASTAEEFRRVAEEKARQGTTSQTVEKEADAFQETMAGDTSFETVKESFKKPPGRGNIHKTGDESDPVEK